MAKEIIWSHFFLQLSGNLDASLFLVLKCEILTTGLYVFALVVDWLMEGVNVEHLNDMMGNSIKKVKNVCPSQKIAIAWRDFVEEIFSCRISHYFHSRENTKLGRTVSSSKNKCWNNVAIIMRF